MKKVKYVLVIIVALMSVVSCSEDDVLDVLFDEDSKDLIGTWGFQESEDDYEIDFTITFNANFSGVLSATVTEEDETVTETENFTWATDGNQLTLTVSGESETSTYSISGNILTIIEDGEAIVLTKQ